MLIATNVNSSRAVEILNPEVQTELQRNSFDELSALQKVQKALHYTDNQVNFHTTGV